MKLTESQLRKIVKEEAQKLTEMPAKRYSPPSLETEAANDATALKEVLRILLDVLDNNDVDDAAFRKISKATGVINSRGIFSK